MTAVLEATRVSDLAELATAVTRTPTTLALADVSVQDDELRLDANTALELDELAVEKLAKFLSLPASYLKKVSPRLRAANFNEAFNNGGEGLASFYYTDEALIGVSDPNKKSLPLSRYLNALTSNFDPDNQVAEFHSEPEYLHVDVVTDAHVEVPGDGSEHRPAVGDITHAGIRLLAYPDLDKPPVVSTYLNRLVCTNGMSVPEVASKISLRGKSIEEIDDELNAVIAGLKIDLGTRLDEYAATANVRIPGETAHFLYNMSRERKLPQAVTQRVIDLGSNLGDNPSVYDAIQIFTSVANENVTYASRLALQGTGGFLAGHTEHALNRCETCQHPFVDFDLV